MQKIILASANKAKLKELQSTLAGKNVQFIPQTEFGIPDAVEDGLSFVENAILKARHASALTGLPALADDSGLEVDALGGEPGVYSARYAGIGNDRESRDRENNRKLLEKLEGIAEPQRTARFQCAIVLMRFAGDPMPLICQGCWEGRILFEQSGDNGFGYDPLFYVPTHQCASAQLDPDVKNSLSHRGQAIRQLLQRWPL